LMNNIFVLNLLVLFEDLGSVNPKHEKIYVYAECDLLLMFPLMTLIDMWWCWYLWWYWFEMTLLMKNHVNMSLCYYWWLCEYEMRLLLLLIMLLRWDDVYVENDIEMECWWCWKCIEMCMLCMFMGGEVTFSDVPCVRN